MLLCHVPPEGTGFYLLDSIRSLDMTALKGTLRHLVLPAGTLALLLSGTFTTALRLNLRRSLRGDYAEAARSRGLSERQVVLRHGLPNALLPVLTIAGITVASLIGGALLIEVTFSWPGIALRLQEAINQRDYPVVQGIVEDSIVFYSRRSLKLSLWKNKHQASNGSQNEGEKKEESGILDDRS